MELGICGRERGSQLERSNTKHNGGTRTHDPDRAALATKTAIATILQNAIATILQNATATILQNALLSAQLWSRQPLDSS